MPRLIDADALRADYFVTSTTTNNPLYRYVSMEQIANAPTVEPASPWHRVEEELPPKATWVLTITKELNVTIYNIATVDARGQWWTCSPQNILRELYGVRYWMPIEPPQEDA